MTEFFTKKKHLNAISLRFAFREEGIQQSLQTLPSFWSTDYTDCTEILLLQRPHQDYTVVNNYYCAIIIDGKMLLCISVEMASVED